MRTLWKIVIIFSILFLIATIFILSSSLRDTGFNPILSRRQLIEKVYPEFADFENQKSFAGTAVKYAVVDHEYYFAYMTLGSGVPIAQATCFKVDRAGRVLKIGLFPDHLDSYMGYRDVDPVTCKGIK